MAILSAERVELGIPKDSLIIPCSTRPDEATSARAAQKLVEQEYKNARPLSGGYYAWRDAGYPIERRG